MKALRPLVVIVLLVGACAEQVTPAELWRKPEAELLYPGSTVLDKREREARQTIDGREAASVGYLLGSDHEPANIEAFYAAELGGLGWQPPTDNQAGVLSIRTTAELSARSWRKGDLVFRLGILDMSHSAAEGPSEGFATIYRIDLVDRPAKPAPT